jgi:hypothetical protein
MGHWARAEQDRVDTYTNQCIEQNLPSQMATDVRLDTPTSISLGTAACKVINPEFIAK